MLIAARSVDIDLIELIRETIIEAKKQKKEERAIFLGEKKKLHGHFVQQTEEVGNEDRWQCLRNGILNRETESLIFPAQEQAIRTNVIKEKINKSQEQTICRMYSRADETLNHIVRECSRLAQRECKRRNDRIGRRIHLKICRASVILFK